MLTRERCGSVPWRGLANVKRGVSRELTYHELNIKFCLGSVSALDDDYLFVQLLAVLSQPWNRAILESCAHSSLVAWLGLA
jgi:hypothetical protein